MSVDAFKFTGVERNKQGEFKCDSLNIFEKIRR